MEIKSCACWSEEEILSLYKAVGWCNYYEHPQMLCKAWENSLDIYGAYEEDRLIGVIRVVGDGYSVILIQDLLVHPDYQRKGIGTMLMQTILAKYAHVYQIQLATDNTEKTKAFYRSLGFRAMEELGCCGFLKV